MRPRFGAAQVIDSAGYLLGKRAELAVVKTKAIPSDGFLPFIVGRHVPARHDSPEGRQGAPLLEPCREPTRERRAGGAAACAVSRRDQLLAGTGLAQVDRGVGGRSQRTANVGAVSGGSLRRGSGGRLDRAAAIVAAATVPAAAVGSLLAGARAL